MNTIESNPGKRSLAPREGLSPPDLRQMWRVMSGALRIDSAHGGVAGRFMRLALPGDVIGVAQWVGPDDTLSRARLGPRVPDSGAGH